jgi:hypothetical protein
MMRELVGIICLTAGAAAAVALAMLYIAAMPRFDVARATLGFLAPVSFLWGGGH